MGIKIKNLQTGEFEKFNIPALKGEKGEPGEIEPSEKVDYIGKQHSKLRDTMNANVDYIIKTAIGEFNYLDYEGQHVTATDTIEGQAKSAILKGQTLVNLVNYKGCFDGREINSDNTFKIDVTKPFQELIIGKEYTFIVYVSQTAVGNISVVSIEFNEKDTGIKKALCTITNPINGVNKVKFTVPSNYGSYLHSYIKTTSVGGSVTVKGMVIEGNHTQEDIPFFTGMQSVKMPVLKATGKNLFDGIWSTTDITYTGRNIWCENYIEVNSNAAYYYSRELNGSGWSCTRQYDADFNLIKESNMGFTGGKITLEPNTKYIKIATQNTHIDEPLMISITKEEYEPYKTNILTANEDVELRGIGDVKDELDCLTGEVTQRIGEVVLDGTGDWQGFGFDTTNNKATARLHLPDSDSIVYKTSSDVLVSDKLKNSYWTVNRYEVNSVFRWDSPLPIIGITLSGDNDINTFDKFKSFLSKNPVKVYYQRITPPVKTVDLSDYHVYSYKDTTHYTCSSAEGSLVPTLSVKVPTDTQLTIQEQKATTQTLLIKNMDLQQSIKEVQAMSLAFNTALYNSFNSIREEVEDIKKHVSTNENLEGSF